MTEKEIEQEIEDITERLKAPVPYYERQMLLADRRDLRKRLAALKAVTEGEKS
jgi:hypothetical protein